MKANQLCRSQFAVAGLMIAICGCAQSDSPDKDVQPPEVAQSKPSAPATPEAPETSNDVANEPNGLETPPPRLSVGAEPSDTETNGAIEAIDADTPTLPDLGGDEETLIEPPPQERPKPMDPPEGAQRFHPEQQVWIDPQRHAVIAHGYVCFREGPLEMFACPERTKEHESIVAVYSEAYLIHAALLGVGAEPGEPVRFVPEFHPPTGTEIDVQVEWDDENGQRHTARAQDWVRDVQTQKAMEHSWVFAGSGFWVDQAGNERYQAEAGDLICVSNFASATLDIPVESTQANEGLAFEAFTERIPPLGTQVRLILTPKLPTPDKGGPDADQANEKRPPL